RIRLGFASGRPSDLEQGFHGARHGARVRGQDRKPLLAHLFHILTPILLGVRYHEAGRQIEDCPEIGVLGAAHLAHRANATGRLHAELRHPDHSIAETKREKRLGPTRNQGDYSCRRGFDLDAKPKIVDKLNARHQSVTCPCASESTPTPRDRVPSDALAARSGLASRASPRAPAPETPRWMVPLEPAPVVRVAPSRPVAARASAAVGKRDNAGFGG